MSAFMQLLIDIRKINFRHVDLFLQCFDEVRWATGRASGLYKVGCWFVGADDLNGDLRVL